MGCCNGTDNSGCCHDSVKDTKDGRNIDNTQISAKIYVCPQCGKETNLQKRMNAVNGNCSNCGCVCDKE
jgi:hypothetical protein